MQSSRYAPSPTEAPASRSIFISDESLPGPQQSWGDVAGEVKEDVFGDVLQHTRLQDVNAGVGERADGLLRVRASTWLPDGLQAAFSCSIFSRMHDGTLHRLFPTAKIDEPLKRYTAWKIGGPADALLEPSSAEELIEAIQRAREHTIPVTILGGGTNVLVLDGGIRGLTIRLARALTAVDVCGTEVVADAGVLYPVLANTTAGKGLGGLEFATGIPGTAGGAVYMNAGAYGSETREVLTWADVYKPEAGVVERIPNIRLGLSYRRSMLHDRPGWIVLRAGYSLSPGDSEELKARIKEFRAQRMNGSPNRPSCGSTFKRPEGDYPGRVIEAAGLKGTRVGQLEISPVHANYFVNHGGGTAEDALALIELARKTVHEKLGIDLETEVRVLGEPPAPS